jgi:hypothetical protein
VENTSFSDLAKGRHPVISMSLYPDCLSMRVASSGRVHADGIVKHRAMIAAMPPIIWSVIFMGVFVTV